MAQHVLVSDSEFPADHACDHAVPVPACSCSLNDAPPRDSDESGDEEAPKARSSAGGNTPPRSRPSETVLPKDTCSTEDLVKAALASRRFSQREHFATQQRYDRSCKWHKGAESQLESFGPALRKPTSGRERPRPEDCPLQPIRCLSAGECLHGCCSPTYWLWCWCCDAVHQPALRPGRAYGGRNCVMWGHLRDHAPVT
jgi:hypothetical protein